MQLLFVFFVFLFTSAESSRVEAEKDMLASLDAFAFEYSQQASQYWDCPQVSSRVGKAEESRIWRTAIPDARIDEQIFANANVIVSENSVYEWRKMRILDSSSTVAKGSFSIQNTAFLGLRKPNFDGNINSKSLKMLSSKSRYINKRALSAMLPQLEQVKNKVMEQMATYQVYPFSPKMALKTLGFTRRCARVPQAVNYHPRVFRDAHFTTADLVAWMAIAAESIRKDQKQTSNAFKAMVRSFLPGFSIQQEVVPTSSAGKSTKIAYMCHSFQYIPAGADHAFYFDGNCGRFLSLKCDSIVLDRSKGIVDSQQNEATVLFSYENVEASNLKAHQTEADIVLRRGFCKLLENTLVLYASSEATDDEVQAYGMAKIRSYTAQF